MGNFKTEMDVSGSDSEFQRDIHAVEYFSDAFLNKLYLRNNNIRSLSQAYDFTGRSWAATELTDY